MRTDWTSEGIVAVDFETQSPVDIKREGGRAYALDRRTRVSIMAARRDDGRTCLWAADWVRLPERVAGVEVVRGPTPPDWVLDASALVAHNALGFDAHVWRAAGWPEVAWRDTMPLCRAGGLPGGLDAACMRLFGRGKDPRGKDLVKALCTARVDSGGRVQYPVGTVAAWEAFGEYCVQDCALLTDLHDRVRGYGEPRVLEVDAVINERGFPIDAAFAVRLVEVQRECAERAKAEMHRGTLDQFDPDNAGSQQKFRAFCARLGVRLDSLDRRALREFMEDPTAFCECEDDEDGARLAVQLLVLRGEIVRATQGKACQMMAAASVDGDGRARWQTVAYGAHTGRWTGRQVQPHNFARGSASVDAAGLCREMMDAPTASVAYEAVAREAARASELDRARVTPADVLGALLRPCIAGDGRLAVADYGQVEARWVARAAREDWELDLFRRLDGDVYSDVARRALGRQDITKDERWLFKQAVLGAGYQMGARRFGAMLVAAGKDPETMPFTPEETVKLYREQHSKVKALWYDLEKAARECVETGNGRWAGWARFEMQSEGLAMVLPSGRRLYYRDARVEMRVPRYCAMYNLPPVEKPQVVYVHPRGYVADLYGGKLLENMSQGGCRDIMADALVRAEDAGMRPVLHVHDELVASMDDPCALAELMSVAPDWADGFPILVEAFGADRYFKNPPKGEVKFRSMGGVTKSEVVK